VIQTNQPPANPERFTLQFAQRLRPPDQRAVGIHHGITGIFPGHVLITTGERVWYS
jgi:hypothetical protein